MTILAGVLIEAGHMAPPPPDGPDPFSMASDQRVRALLQAAGFAVICTDEVPVRFAFSDVEDYLGHAADTAGLLALVLRGLSGAERSAVGTRLQAAFAPFAAAGGYAIPGLALTAAAG